MAIKGHNLTDSEISALRDAIYKVSDARYMIADVNNAMKSESRWEGQGDIAALLSALQDVCDGPAGHYLRTL